MVNLSLVINCNDDMVDKLPVFLIDLDYFISKLRRTSVEYLIVYDGDDESVENTVDKFKSFINKIELISVDEFKSREKSDNNVIFYNTNISFETMEKLNSLVSSDDDRAVVFSTDKNIISRIGNRITNLLLKVLKLKSLENEKIKPGGNLLYLSKNSLVDFDLTNPELSYLYSSKSHNKWSVIGSNRKLFFVNYLSLWGNLIKVKLNKKWQS